ncbi:MAG: nitroreductase family protein [Sphaerobacteraceae bacterium]|nr:MAG: nitroreductase family protein [Sphaerobacteraceae bacterium]
MTTGDDSAQTPHIPVPLEFQRISADESLQRSRDFLETMRTRRSIRHFSPEPVQYEIIANAVATAGTAPSGANQQPWTFVVISDQSTKDQIRQAAENTERDFYERRISEEWRGALRPLGTDHQKPHLSDAPYLVVVFEHPFGLEFDEKGEEVKRKHYYAQESVGIAVGLFIASITNAGLCCLTHTPSPMIFLRDLLERPRNERPFVVIPVGYPADDATVPAHASEKKPLDEILIHVSSLNESEQ